MPVRHLLAFAPVERFGIQRGGFAASLQSKVYPSLAGPALDHLCFSELCLLLCLPLYLPAWGHFEVETLHLLAHLLLQTLKNVSHVW